MPWPSLQPSVSACLGSITTDRRPLNPWPLNFVLVSFVVRIPTTFSVVVNVLNIYLNLRIQISHLDWPISIII